MRLQALQITLNDDEMIVELSDGRSIAVPLAWYPRLAHASIQERAMWRLIGGGTGLHWPDVEEDISVESLLAGRRSAESKASLLRWLESRTESVGKV